MLKYTEEQLSKMAVNPGVKGKMLANYPYLGELLHKADLTHGEMEDSLIRYLALVYDPSSPMVRQFPDPKDRKRHAAELMKFKYEDRHLKFTVMFLQKVVRSMEWRVICAKEHAFGEYEERVYDPIDTSEEVKDSDIMSATQKKALLLKEMREIATELPLLKEHFYGGDIDLEEAAERKDYRPEAMAGIKK